MKCPKCGYVSFNYLDTCKGCGRDLAAFKAEHALWGIKPGTLSIYSSTQRAVGQKEPRPGPAFEDLPDLEEGLPHDLEMMGEGGMKGAVHQEVLSQASQEADLGGISLDLEEIDLEEEEITLDLQDKEEEAAIELEEIDLEEAAAEGREKKEPPGEVPVIELALEEIDLGGSEPEKEPLLEMELEEEEAEEASDLLDLDEIELSWEEEEEEGKDPGKKGS